MEGFNMLPKMTLEEFLKNPAGKGSNAIVGRELILQDLEDRYYRLLERKDRKRQFKHRTFYNKEKDTYYVHVLVPTESSERENNYDVLVVFSPPETVNVENDSGLQRYHVKYFSNMPSFTFTYANVFYNNDWLVDGTEKKYDEKVIELPPNMRNPFYSTSYEKSIVFSLMYIRDVLRQLYTSKDVFIKNSAIWGDMYIAALRHTETIMEEYKKETNRVKRKKRKGRSSGPGGYKSPKQPKGSSARGVSKTGKASSAKRTPKTRRVKRTRGSRRRR